MKLRKSIAFLIALSMLVGLVFTIPASALTPVEGYAETVMLEEDFSKTVSDKLTVFNGSVKDGALSFDLSSESYVALNEGFETTNYKQFIVDFDMTTTKAYSDPWTASFIGIRLNKVQMKPTEAEYGAWVGITTDKVILWFSHELSTWGEGEEGVDYLVLDAPSDLAEASYRIIYEGKVVELYANDALLVSFALVDDYAVMTAGDDSLQSTIKFADTRMYRYFAIYNSAAANEEEADDPLASKPTDEYLPKDPETPDDPDEPGEPDDPETPDDPDEPETPEDPGEDGIPEDTEMQAGEIVEIFAEEIEVEFFAEESDVVTVDNLKIVYYRDQLVTEATIEALEGVREAAQAILDAYYTEETEDDIYISNSVVESKVENVIARVDETLAIEGLLEKDAQEVYESVKNFAASFVTVADAENYPAKFADFEELLEGLLEDPDSNYSASAINAVLDKIDAAKALVETEGITNSALDKAYNEVLLAISNLNIYTADGIPAYTQSFTGSYSLSQFEKDWYHTGSSHQAVPVTTEKGIPVNLWGPLPGQTETRYKMDFKKSYPVYSVQATLTREAQGKVMFGIRQTMGSDTYESHYSVSPAFLSYQGVSIQEPGLASDFSNVYVVIRDGRYKTTGEPGSRIYTKINLASIPGVLSEDRMSFTPLIKDFGELVEIYAVKSDGEKVLLAKVVFDAIVKKVTANKSNVDGYSSGTLYNMISGEVIPFNGMCIQLAKNSVIGFSSRSGRYFVKDFKINTNILPDEEVLVYDGSTDPKSLAIDIENETIDVDDATDFAINAEFDLLKVAGKDEFKAGSIDVKAAPAVTVTAALGETVVKIDTVNGTITGVNRGTDIITATYTGADGTTYTDKTLITVAGEEYTAPTEDEAFAGRIVAAKFANANVYRSIEVGTEVIPVIEYEYPNGSTGILPAGSYVKYFSEDNSVIAYDEEKGAFVAKATGYAKIYAEVYMTLSTEPVKSALVNVEVAAEGEATLGASTTVAAMDLIAAAQDDSLTTEEKKAVIDNAIVAEIEVSYNDDLDAELLMAAIASLAENGGLTNDEIIKKASANAKGARKVYDVVNKGDTTADDLADLLFGEDAIYKDLSLNNSDVKDYMNLTKTKSARVMSRLFTQIEKEGTDLTAQFIAESFSTIVKTVKEGAGSGKGGTTITTDKNNGSVSFPAAKPVEKPAEVVKEVITVEQANAEAAKFSDVEDAAWAKYAIGTLTHKGVINGYEDGTIRPNGMITRDEFVKILVVAFELDIKKDAYNYFWEDVTAGGWQVPYIAAAHEANILVGTNGGSFGSNVRITREDMAAMIYKAVQMKKATLPSDKMVAFTDADNISTDALEAVNKLAAAGVISGMGDGTFAPAAGATRAQAFQMIALILDVM